VINYRFNPQVPIKRSSPHNRILKSTTIFVSGCQVVGLLERVWTATFR